MVGNFEWLKSEQEKKIQILIAYFNIDMKFYIFHLLFYSLFYECQIKASCTSCSLLLWVNFLKSN